MTIDAYLDRIELAAQRCLERGTSSLNELETLRANDAAAFDTLVATRRAVVTCDEAEVARGYLSLGVFQGLEENNRAAAICACFDIDRLAIRKRFEARLAPYRTTQPLFRAMPTLEACVRNPEKDNDLIGWRCLSHEIAGSRVVEHAGGFGLLDGFLSPKLVEWFAAHFSAASMFVRLSPLEGYSSRPPEQLDETVLRPANPKWWKRLSLSRGVKDGGHYALPNADRPDTSTAQAYWDYHAKGIRTLEALARRDGNTTETRLTMMIEELSAVHSNASLLVGRCMHCDTLCPYGTDASAATLNHLDLAIQVYSGSKIEERRNASLSQGSVVDADCRSHIFRVEGVPFPALFVAAHLFFESRVLVTEWLDDQFRGWDGAFADPSV